MTINAPVASSARASLTTTAGGGGGGFDFNTIPGLVAWYDASYAAGITASGGAVSQVLNRKTGAGAGTHLVQGTGSLQPTTGTRTQAGKNVLDFNADTMTATLPTTAQPFTICVVFLTDSTATQVISATGTVSAYLAAGTVNLYTGTGALTGAAFTTATPYLAQFECVAGNNKRVYVNAGVSGLGNNGDDGWTGAFEIGGQGGANFLDGWIAEWHMYSGLSSGNRATVHTELRNKWSVY